MDAELMESSKSYAHKKRKKRVSGNQKREHKNRDFYNSKAWRDTRRAYMMHYQQRLYKHIPEAYWGGMGLSAYQVSYLLALIDGDFLPCEICLRHYAADAYETVEKGVELDHIIPINKDNALDTDGYGDPFSFDNLQLLCKRHHAKKSQRERKLA